MTYRLEATYYRTALLLGLIPGEDVHRWAERIIEQEPTPPHEFLDLVLIPPSDLSALRYGLWPLTVEPEPGDVFRAILGLLHADLTAARRGVEDTVTVLRQMRSMLRLPAPLYADLNEALVSHGLAKATGGTIGAWLQQFAPAQHFPMEPTRVGMTKRRSIVVHIGTSADGYIARPDGDLEWLTSRPKPEGFYGMSAFVSSIDTKLLGRKTYDMSRRMGATFDSKTTRTFVFSRHAPPADAPPGVEFVNGAIGPFVSRLRAQPGKDIWLLGGGELIASFLDEQAIDEFVVTVAPVFIGDGIPLLARRHRHLHLDLQSVERFKDGVVQLHYRVHELR